MERQRRAAGVFLAAGLYAVWLIATYALEGHARLRAGRRQRRHELRVGVRAAGQAVRSAGNNRESVLKLDLGGLNSVGNAKLRLYGRLSGDSSSGVQLAAYASKNDAWGEATVTWNTRPASTGGALSSVTVRGTSARRYGLDLADHLRAEKAAGRNTVTTVLKGAAATSPYVRFNSDDAGGSRPELVGTP